MNTVERVSRYNEYPQTTAKQNVNKEKQTRMEEKEGGRRREKRNIKMKSQLMYRNEEHLLATYSFAWIFIAFHCESVCVYVYVRNEIDASFFFCSTCFFLIHSHFQQTFETWSFLPLPLRNFM